MGVSAWPFMVSPYRSSLNNLKRINKSRFVVHAWVVDLRTEPYYKPRDEDDRAAVDEFSRGSRR
jgi:hypothetical protein